MASAKTENGHESGAINEQELREVRELFKGRYPRDVIQDLFRHFHGDKTAVVDYLLKRRSSNEPETDNSLQKINERLQSLNLKTDVNEDFSGTVESKVRQFACGSCDRDWWKRVPVRKQVSCCDKCKKRLDPVAHEEEFGWAVYECKCGHKFSGYGQKNKTSSPCYKCGESIVTHKIKPRGRRTRKSDSEHKCDAADCASKEHNTAAPAKGTTTQAENIECVHPRTRQKRGKRKIIVASKPHDSTGSTVDTFLPEDLGVLSDEEKVIFSSDDEKLHPIPENEQHD